MLRIIVSVLGCMTVAFFLTYPFCKVASEADRAMENIMDEFRNASGADTE